jgi:hypothetical protein
MAAHWHLSAHRKCRIVHVKKYCEVVTGIIIPTGAGEMPVRIIRFITGLILCG